MRLIHLPVMWTVALDIFLWIGIHMGVSWTLTRLPAERFRRDGWLFRRRTWESVALYDQYLGVKKWKGLLPDAATWFKGGFPKKRLQSRQPSYLERFVLETRRGEAAHWIALSFSPLFFLWNPAWAGIVILVYGVAGNLPCILVQRSNRLRVTELLKLQME